MRNRTATWCAGAGGQAATLEADFLESLLETRKLQLKADATAEQLTSTASASTAADAMVSAEKARHGALEQLQKEVPEALKECAALLNHLVTHRTALACLLNAAKVGGMHMFVGQMGAGDYGT